ncbi:hypothetical protein U0070_013510 [Myodes glareolus]|uniref:Uncharacterized protein n=1 Tax=Myodes glareolus TaxID=447135 RepID=A0AAW0I8T9_MYOGA
MCVHVVVLSVINVKDGIIYSFIIKDSKYQVKNFVEVDAPVAHLAFSPSYKTLLIQTDKGTVYIYTFGAEPALDKVLESCDGKVLAMDFITPGTKHFLLSKWAENIMPSKNKLHANVYSSIVHHDPDSENNRGAVPPVKGETVEQSHNMLLLSNKKK